MIQYQELGLSQYEAKAYDALVRFGKAPASKISAESQVPYGRIYDVLESLIHKGLVKVLPGKTKEYVPTDPQTLLNLLKKKQHVLQDAEKEIQELKKFYEVTVKEPIIIAQGRRNFYVLNKELKESEKSQYTIRYIAEPKPEWIREAKSLIKKGVDIKNLTRYDDETKKNVSEWINKTGKRWKIIENEGIAIDLRDDEEILISLVKSNVTMLIRDKSFAKLMKKLFLAYWEKTPLIK